MHKKPRVRTLMDSHHVKRSDTVLKFLRQYFCHILWSLSGILSSKNSVLVVSEMLRLLVKSLTPDDKYSLSVKASPQHNYFKCNYLQIGKYFLNFFLHFQNLHKICNTLKKKMTLRGDFFLTLSTASSGLT